MPFDLSTDLEKRKAEGLWRQRLSIESAQGVDVVANGQRYSNFCSNDYLSLASDDRIVQALQASASNVGVGSGASHLVVGHHAEHDALENELAAMCQRDAALIFSTGYMANLGVITALLSKQDAVFEDKLNHASLIDGGLLSQAAFRRYLHNDVSSLETHLTRSSARRKLVVTDTVFSMDGDQAPLRELANISQASDAWLMVDDAHGFGVLGPQGGGAVLAEGLDQQAVPIVMGTLGKAVGTGGAFVAGSQELIDTLIQFSRSYIYTTAMPPALASATRSSLKIIQQADDLRSNLQGNISYFRRAAEQLNLPLMLSETAIQPLLVGNAEVAVSLSLYLREQGFLVSAIRPPTVPKGSSRLRITLCAGHRQDQIDQLLDVLVRGIKYVSA